MLGRGWRGNVLKERGENEIEIEREKKKPKPVMQNEGESMQEKRTIGEEEMQNGSVAQGLSQVVNASFLGHTLDGNILMFINPRQATQQKPSLTLGELKPLHQLSNGHVLLRGQASGLMVEVIDHGFQGAASLVLGWRTRGADGRDGS